MKCIKQLSLFGCVFLFSFFLTACGPTEQNTGTPSLTAPTEGTKINDNIYIYYYGQTCSHCKKVEDYLKQSGVDQWITIIPKEVTMNETNRNECLAVIEELNVGLSSVVTPFIVIEKADGTKSTLIGEDEALTHFKELEQQIKKLNAE